MRSFFELIIRSTDRTKLSQKDAVSTHAQKRKIFTSQFLSILDPLKVLISKNLRGHK